jgi:LysR family glycine cleavage system transcriptional activator
MIVEAAVAGMGYALLPRYLIERELRSGDLAVVFDTPMETDNSYYVVVPEAKSTNALANNFIGWLLAEIGSNKR